MRDVGCTPLYQGQGMRHGLTFRNNSYNVRIAGPVLTEHGHGPRATTDAARPTDSGTLSRRTRASALIRPPQWSMLTLCTVDPPRPDLRPPTRITLLLRSNAVYMRCLQLQLPQTPELNGSAFCGSAERSKTE